MPHHEPAPEPGSDSTQATASAPRGSRWRPGQRLTHLVLLAGASIAVGFVLSPGLTGHQVPSLTRADLDKPFQAGSPSGFKAQRDYEISHQSLTEQRRQEASASVRPVYDFNPSVVSEVEEALAAGFGKMRALLANPQPRPVNGGGDDPLRSKEDAARPQKRAPLLPAALLESLLREQPAFEQQVFGPVAQGLEEDDFRALIDAGFSPAAEQAVRTLLRHAYAAPVVTSREELQREGPQGITLRDVRTQQERPLGLLSPEVSDIREVQAELERYASVPGNLLPDAPALQRRAVLRVARRLVRANLTINIATTAARRQEAARAVKDAILTVKKGQRVIGDGELVNESHLVLVEGMRAQTDELDRVQLQIGGTGIAALLIAAMYAFCRAAFRRFRPTRKDALLVATLLVGLLGMLQVWTLIAEAVHDHYPAIPYEALLFAAPAAAGAMLVRFLLGEAMALFFALVFTPLAAVMLGNSLSFGLVTLVGSLLAAERIGRAKDRVGVFKAGAITGAVLFPVIVFLALSAGRGASSDTWISATFALAGASFAVPVLVMALTPLIEATFGYASDIKLLELANLNHPALKELIVQAPGTYHHSIILGTLVENAAEEISANPLLARSCAYYHDIGKGRNPLHFGENQKGENRHDALSPAVSAQIIKRHVSEGLEMARRYRLPKLVADAIPQHHGTRLVGYFFHKALKEQEGREDAVPVDEAAFRYPGPKPQFPEAALVMIADAVEASCRAMSEPTRPRLQAQVQKMINMIFMEGQLDECDLTLKDLNGIAHSFTRTLEGIYHARPVYPAGAIGGRPATPPSEVGKKSA